MTVFLVGAGPGDPGLLTLRGAEALAMADVVVFDRLSVGALLELAPLAAEQISVAKSAGQAVMAQDDINELLIEKARQGKTVVRLKGGDPFVFARGGEEAAALAAAGIHYEVVPGVTSAIAVPAYAGIPVTLRHSSTSFGATHGPLNAFGDRSRTTRIAERHCGWSSGSDGPFVVRISSAFWQEGDRYATAASIVGAR